MCLLPFLFYSHDKEKEHLNVKVTSQSLALWLEAFCLQSHLRALSVAASCRGVSGVLLCHAVSCWSQEAYGCHSSAHEFKVQQDPMLGFRYIQGAP